MKKIFSLFVCIILISGFTSACTQKTKSSMVKSERRFAKYMEPKSETPSGMVDLSEGPRLRYNANFGPKEPSFDFKVVDPY